MLEALSESLEGLSEARKDRDDIASLLREQISSVQKLLSIEEGISEAIQKEIRAQTAELSDWNAQSVTTMEEGKQRLREVLDRAVSSVGEAAQQVRESISETARTHEKHSQAVSEATRKIEEELRTRLGEAVEVAKATAQEMSEELSAGIRATSEGLTKEIVDATQNLEECTAGLQRELDALREGVSTEEGRFSGFMIEKRANISALMSVVEDNANRLAASLSEIDKAQAKVLGDLTQLGARAQQIVDTMSELESQSRDVSTGIGRELAELVRDEVRTQMGGIQMELSQIREALSKRKFIF